MSVIARKLDTIREEYKAALVSKAKTESLDELRYLAGVIDGLQKAIQLLIQSETQEKK